MIHAHLLCHFSVEGISQLDEVEAAVPVPHASALAQVEVQVHLSVSDDSGAHVHMALLPLSSALLPPRAG